MGAIIQTTLNIPLNFVITEKWDGQQYSMEVEGRCAQTGEQMSQGYRYKLKAPPLTQERRNRTRAEALDVMTNWIAIRMTKPDGQGRTIRPLTLDEMGPIIMADA